jgi:hypothetical protein
MLQKSKIMVGGPIIRLVIVLSVLMFFIPSVGYAEGEPNVYGGMANSFEEALEKNVRLRERYEGVSTEQQLQMQERWQARLEKWNGMSDEEKEAMKERRANRSSKGGHGRFGR